MSTEPAGHSVSVAGIVMDDHGRALLARRRDNHRWEPPGGVLELAEPVDEGLRREVREETGLAVEPVRLTGVYKNMDRGIVALVFSRIGSRGACGAASGAPAPGSASEGPPGARAVPPIAALANGSSQQDRAVRLPRCQLSGSRPPRLGRPPDVATRSALPNLDPAAAHLDLAPARKMGSN